MNMVQCKQCNIDFDYSPGNSGNARQLCDLCRSTMDKEELEQLKEETILENNRYMCKKSVYDPVDILMNGNIPKFDSDGDRFICATEIGNFIRSSGTNGVENGLVKLLISLPYAHRMLIMRQMSTQTMETFTKYSIKNHPEYASSMAKMVEC